MKARITELESRSRWLDAQADAHLRRRRSLDRANGCLSDYQLRRLALNDRKRASNLGAPGLPREADETAFELHLSYLIREAGLTYRQEACVRLRLQQHSIADIAAMTGRRPAGVQGSLLAAYRRLRKACEEAPYAGWYEVYVAEVTRKPMR